MTDCYRPDWKKGLYRSRGGMIFGCCKGLAEYFNISAFWLRVLLVIAGFFTGFFPLIIGYIIAALLMKPEPIIPFASEADRENYDTYMSSRSMALGRLKRTYSDLDRRIQRIESIVTSPEFRWNAQMEKR
ncbi:MAG: PspC domain-containing protein [Candidatus Sumerlaeota bacterium]|nr:PspC domain-containing protein [Candidatus Sumerlaeota bacterium]